MNVNPRIAVEERQQVAQRIRPGESAIVAANIRTPSQLAYAIRFLMDHYTYKRSKGGLGVNGSAGSEALQAIGAAADTFNAEVLGKGPAKPTVPPVSPMAEGQIGNPWAYVQG